ncbi:MAG: DUF5372 family protein, partial [Bryobacteraceae bacterium]
LNVEHQRFRVTHPFHPWFGREFALVTYRQNWGEDRVYFHDEAGQLIALPARWTSIFPSDPFVVLSAGRSPFCFAQLLELARLIQHADAVQSSVSCERGP